MIAAIKPRPPGDASCWPPLPANEGDARIIAVPNDAVVAYGMIAGREDFFDYLPAPLYEDGIRMPNVLVLVLRLIVAEA